MEVLGHGFFTKRFFGRIAVGASKQVPFEVKPLHVPPLQEAVEFINKNLKLCFGKVHAEVVDCPDLSKEPFNLVGQGLNGKPKIVEIGGNAYLFPVHQPNKVYDLKNVAKFIKSNPSFIIGTGIGRCQSIALDCEGVYNLRIDNDTIHQKTMLGKYDKETFIYEILPENDTSIVCVGNLFVSEGKPGKVLKVYAKTRNTEDNFITCMRKIFEVEYGNKHIGMGGVVLMKEGKAKHHVMKDISKAHIEREDQIMQWVQFYNMSAPMVSVGTFLNSEMVK